MSRRVFRVLAVIGAVVAFVATMAVAPPAHAGCSVAPDPTMSPEEGPTGTVITFTLEGSPSTCTPVSDDFQDVYFIVGEAPDLMPGEGLAQSMITDPEGNATVQYTIPDGTAPGEMTFYLTIYVEYTGPSGSVASVHGFSRSGLTGVYKSYGPYTFTVTVEPSISVSKTELLPGEDFTVKATGFEPGTEVEVFLESDPVLLATVTASQTGSIAAAVQVPADFPAGPHTVAAVGTGLGGGALRLSTGVTIGALAGDAATTTTSAPAVAPAAAPTATGTNTLPLTGTESTLALVGAGLLLAGGLTVMAARRREA